MKRSRFSDERRTDHRHLKEHQAGLSATELCRKYGVSDATFSKWRSNHGGMDVSEAKRSERRRFGYGQLHLLLKREGVAVNWKKLYRLCREERLTVLKRGAASGHWAPERRWESRRVPTSAGASISSPIR